jgi:hypothetical protein
MSTAHTPGPWHHDRGAILTADRRCLAEVYSGPCDSLAEHRENCRLIAAAPELLRVARLALEELEWLSLHTPQALREDLRRVIASASTTPNTTESEGA